MTQEKQSDRRAAPRVSYLDTVQFTEVRTRTDWRARLSDVSLTGCYIEMLNPPPQGSEIRVRLRLGGQTFEAQAVVARCEPNMGMGVHFTHIEPEQRAILEKFVAEHS